MNELFSRAHHICIVVADIDAAIAYYEDLGIGGWQSYPDLSQYDNAELDVPDRQAFLRSGTSTQTPSPACSFSWSNPDPATHHSDGS
jgi:catechol 2,3-dioxygenase-like lactoylglutathione lyase family enzyme